MTTPTATTSTDTSSTDHQHHRRLARFRRRPHEPRDLTAVHEFFENLVVLLGFPSGG